MTDRELLELAAKAAGIDLMWPCLADLSPRRADNFNLWNPLTDDGDALRLLAALNMDLWFERNRVCVGDSYTDRDGWGFEEMGADAGASIRRAIVRAALK